MARTKQRSRPCLSVRKTHTTSLFCKTHPYEWTPMSGKMCLTFLIWKGIFTWTAQGIQCSLFLKATSLNGQTPLNSYCTITNLVDVSHWRPLHSLLLSRNQKSVVLQKGFYWKCLGIYRMEAVVLRLSEPEAEWRHCACILCNHFTQRPLPPLIYKCLTLTCYKSLASRNSLATVRILLHRIYHRVITQEIYMPYYM